MSDEEAIELAIETALNAPEDVKGRHDQIRDMLLERSREEVGRFCAYHMQFDNLKLKPWERAPCDSSGEGNDPAARLVRRLRKAGISQYHPNPLAALQEAGAGTGLA